ncbi:MAG TPA: FGGY-family carbohydrate kinase, partial [Candidatus Limiplasma sp.]|nr:FGGY-family carbohydrate kinase [Candidatus Limiplasma sp.]
IVGLTRGSGRAQFVRAALESIAYQSADLFTVMADHCGQKPARLQADGGASMNAFLMQFQADILGIPVVRPKINETTALGAAMLAGIGTGTLTLDQARTIVKPDLTFTPQMDEVDRANALDGWHRAVERALRWQEP